MRPFQSYLTLFLLSLSSLVMACDAGSEAICTELDADPFLPHVNFDGTTNSYLIQGWGARGVFSSEDASDLTMEVRSEDPQIISIDHSSPRDAQALLNVRGSGSTEVTVTVSNDCGHSVSKSFSVDSVLPLGRTGDFCESRPSGRWTDFWPLEAGNSWTFYYEARVSDENGGYRRRGEATLSILSAHCRTSRWEYLASFSFDYVVFLNSQRDQTNQHWTYVDSVTIEENELGELTLNGFGEVEQLKIRDIRAQRWHRDNEGTTIELFQEWQELERAESRIILEKGRGPITISLGARYADVLQDDWFRLTDWYVASEL